MEEIMPFESISWSSSSSLSMPPYLATHFAKTAYRCGLIRISFTRSGEIEKSGRKRKKEVGMRN
jgi:hypothetical protein